MEKPFDQAQGKLSIVATPIGNLGDITFRALWNLKECSAIYAEDTRVTLKLLNHYGVRKPIFRLDAATEDKKANEVIERLSRGEHIAYVTDAGTPGVSDPGARLVARVRAELPEVTIDAVPGPSALTAALSIAGMQSDSFIFFGFLPHKKGRQTSIKEIKKSKMPVVLYESPHRIKKLLRELEMATPKRTVTLARELTKMHEEVLSGIPSQLIRVLEENHKERGEFVVIIA